MKLKKEFQISLWEDFMDSKNLINFSGNNDYYYEICSWEDYKKISETTIQIIINDKEIYNNKIDLNSQNLIVTDQETGYSYELGRDGNFLSVINLNEIAFKIDCVIHSTDEPYFSFINERKICDIASDTLENPRAAYNVVFKSKTDGTHTLTFDMNSRYWDHQEQDFIDNPIIKHLYNEAKVKLKYKGKWYDLIIKNCQENSKEKKYSYSCEDLFIDELGRNGYNIEFSTELGGNVNTVTELGSAALEGSDWTIDKEKSVVPIQKISEPVYAFTFTSGGVSYQEINKDGGLGITGTINASSDKPKTIFICHSSATNNKLNGIDYQFYYNENEYYETDEDGNFINTNPKFITGISPDLEESEFNTLRIQYSSATHTFMPQYRGYRYVRSPKTEWLPKIKRQVTVYKGSDNKEYYGYKKTTYLSPEIAQNLLINSKPGAFNGNSGWLAEATINGVKKDCSVEMTLTSKNGNTLSLGTPSNLRAYYFNGDTKEYPESVKFTNLAFKNNLKNIGAISKGDRFVIRLKQKFNDNSVLLNEKFLGENFVWKGPPDVVYPGNYTQEINGYWYAIYESNASFSYKELLNRVSGAPEFSAYTTNGIFEGGDLFRYYTYIDNGVEKLITPETTIQSQNLIKNEYYYFTKEQYKACTNEDDLQMSFKSDEELAYVYRDKPFEKIATLEVKETNYFNIIQTLNEKFECWAKFEIAHEENGTISVDAATGKRIKKVIFCDYIGKENFAGFKYGINLNSIQRTVDSKEITTKTIVKANSNEFAPSGSCNIARASQNPSGTQFILNLNYFTHQKVLKQFEIDNDLYVESDGYLGYYTKLKRLNNALQEIEEQLIAIESSIIKADRDIQAANVNEEDFLEDINNVNAKLANNYISVNGNTNKQLAAENPIFYKSESENDKYGNVYKWCYHSNIIFYKVNEEDGEAGDAYPPGQHIIYNVENGKKLVDTYNNFIESRFYAINNKRKLEEDKANLVAQRDGEYSYIDVDGNLQEVKNNTAILPTIKQLDSQFYSKYSRFIREGTWSSEDYTDDELYYLDACSVAYTSAFPKTTYSISVVDIKNSIVPDELGYDYSAYDFECGDFTTMEDTEFFGWKEDGITPYKEKVVISEIEEHLDNISANKITVQNYKTQFDELFQRITAATQTLELRQGEYERASKVVNVNGEINKTFLQNTLYNNSLILENVGAQEVIWGSEGIISTDLNNPLLKTRIVGGGVVITEDGGETWSTGISGQGINASMIKTGQLDANRIRIMNGNDASFFWDSEGILAYSKANNGGYNYDKYVKFNRQGIEGRDTDRLVFKLDWDGIIAKKGQIGNWYIGDYDIQYNNPTESEPQFKAYISAQRGSKDYLHFGTTTATNGNNVFTGFRVDNNGKLWATGAEISGIINATAGGTIAGWNIGELSLWCQGSNNGKVIGLQVPNRGGYWGIAVGASNNSSWSDAPFKVDFNGNMYAKSGRIGAEYSDDPANQSGWVIQKNSLTSGTLGSSGSFHMYTSFSGSHTVGTHSDSSWRLLIGSNFGVNNEGAIYANKGYIGDCEIRDGKLIINTIDASMIDTTNLRINGQNIDGVVNEAVYAASSNYAGNSGYADDAGYADESGYAWWLPDGGSIGTSWYVGSDSYQGHLYCNNGFDVGLDITFERVTKLEDSTKTTLWSSIIKAGQNAGSDINAKNSIEEYDSRYETLFDGLKPCKYKYNLGNSGRYHTGFIAQEVLGALEKAKLSTLDFAAIQKLTEPDENGAMWSLRRDEFVSLNTWQIQKLKTRVTDLETEISNLKLQLQNLQNS